MCYQQYNIKRISVFRKFLNVTFDSFVTLEMFCLDTLDGAALCRQVRCAMHDAQNTPPTRLDSRHRCVTGFSSISWAFTSLLHVRDGKGSSKNKKLQARPYHMGHGPTAHYWFASAQL